MSIFRQDFIVWGLVVLYLLVQVAYLIWMSWANRRERGAAVIVTRQGVSR